MANPEIALTVTSLRLLLSQLPDDMPVEIFNGSFEWYGIEPLEADQMREIDGRLVVHFGGPWSDDLVDDYRKARSKEEDTDAF